MAKKILITYASSGAGHRRAAEALLEALLERRGHECEVHLIDALDYTNPFFRRTYPATYLFLIRSLPLVWGAAFHLVDLPLVRQLVRFARRFMNALNARRLEEYIQTLNPEVVLSTHFFPDEVLTELKRQGLWRGTHISCITDFGVHGFWVQPLVDRYVVGSQVAKYHLIEQGIPSTRIEVLGIPIDPAFAEPVGREAFLSQLGLDPRRTTILVLSGGFGVGPVERIAEMVGAMDSPQAQAIVVCGRHPKLQREAEAIAKRARMPMIVLGYVTNMDEIMAVADLAITKSGGLTVAEALARQTPLIIIDPIPGQEQINCELVIRQGAGVLVKDLEALRMTLVDLLTHPERLQEMKVACSVLGKPHAAEAVAELALKSLVTSDRR